MESSDKVIAKAKARITAQKFKNEYQMVKALYAEEHDLRRIAYIKEFSKDPEEPEIEKGEKESNKKRKLANLMMEQENGDRRIAVKIYTDAILAAPVGSLSLVYAHANRSYALKELGYHQAAYDDLLCALEYGCPEQLRPNIIFSQAKLAADMRDIQKLKRHMEEMEIFDSVRILDITDEEMADLQRVLVELEEEEEVIAAGIVTKSSPEQTYHNIGLKM